MARDVVSAKLDIIFKKIFSENKDMLESFISSMLDIPLDKIKEITLTNPEIPPESYSGKFSRLDMTMKVDNRLVNVEIQIKNDNDFRDRTLFYWAKLYTSELKSGDDYGELKQTITINIINFNMFGGNDFHTEVAAMIKGTNEVFSDKMSIHFCELKKLSKKPNPDNSRELWLQFINADSEEDLEMINQTNIPIMQKAVRVIYDMSENTRIKEEARLREKALHDEASALKQAKNEGREEGRAEGREEGRAEGREEGRAEGRAEGRTEGEAKKEAEIISKMKAAGLSESEIQRILNL